MTPGINATVLNTTLQTASPLHSPLAAWQSLLQKMMQTNQLSLYNKDNVILLSKGLVLELCLGVSSFIC